MTVIYLVYGWSNYHGQKTWGEYWRDLSGWNHWRYPWLATLFFGFIVAQIVYGLIRSHRKQPVQIWPFLVAVAGGLMIYVLELFPRHFAWSDLSDAVWWRHHWHGLPLACLYAGLFAYPLSLFLIDSYRNRQKRRAEADWNRSLDALVDRHDFKDREDLYAYLDAAERTRLLQALQRQPKGSRSLAKAVQSVCPDLLEDDA
jgi:hypothetical protein